MVVADTLCDDTIKLAFSFARALDESDDDTIVVPAPKRAGEGASQELMKESERRLVTGAAMVLIAVDMLPAINGHRHALISPDGVADGWQLQKLEQIEVDR